MSAVVSRRQLMAGAASAALAARIPIVADAQPIAIATERMWAVGTPGGMDWEAIRAFTAQDAKAFWLEENGFECVGDEMEHFDLAVDRVKAWDDLGEDVKPADWIRAGYGHICSRCGYESFPQDGAQVVNDKVVCEDCITIEDWRIIDPGRAAELEDGE